MRTYRKAATFRAAVLLAAFVFLSISGFAQSAGFERIPPAIQNIGQFLHWIDTEFEYCMSIPDERKTVEETLKSQRGDCEDFARLTHYFLTEIAHKESYIIFIKFKGLEIQHAICAWRNSKGYFCFTSNMEYCKTRFKTIEELLGSYFWHSSGLTTTVCGALKEALRDVGKEIGLFACGGKGRTSRNTPMELDDLAQRRLITVGAEKLKYASRMAAKVDNTALQDGYQLYHHTFFVTKEGEWAVIQQGMNENTKWARRYHWLGENVKDFVCEPHEAICCDHTGSVLNMIANESAGARDVTAFLAGEKPEKITNEYTRIKNLRLASHHDVRLKDIRPENLNKILTRTYERKPKDFEALLGTEGVGPGTIRALALISELVYAKSPSFKDPVRFSFAHGGKDGHPYPVNRERYDQSIAFLREAVLKAKIGHSDKMNALKKLSSFLT
jgi:hypothetical protein